MQNSGVRRLNSNTGMESVGNHALFSFLLSTMRKTFIFSVLAAIVAFTVGIQANKPSTTSYDTLLYKTELIKAYNAYNKATEELLDTLENQYDWVDGYDAYDYYEAKAGLDSLINLEK